MGLKHRVENPSLAMDLVRWKEEEGEELWSREKITKSIVKKGFNVPLETVPEEEQEKLKAAVEDWNKKHTMKCEYPIQCVLYVVSSQQCNIWQVMVKFRTC